MTTHSLDYALGFAFDSAQNCVALIKKNRPDWQRGLYNGIGGKIERLESPLEAQVREFEEEAGVKTRKSYWNLFAIMTHTDESVRVYCFESASDSILSKIESPTDEVIVIWPIKEIFSHPRWFIKNIQILIPLAMSTEFDRPQILTWTPAHLAKVGVKSHD